MRAAISLLLACIAVIATAVPSAAEEHGFKVIVHPSNSVDSVDRDFLRDAYLGKATEWGGETIRPIDLVKKYPARNQFTKHVLRKTPAQLRTYWTQRIFSGKGVPPPESDADAVIKYVLANKGAVGYLPADVDHGKAKVIQLR
jgi:ABC-type phosphate transport system substrate-binding protein